jgi:acyl-CoA reductase-like NAD-dependent aldehyde dehydrogenase
LNCGQNCIAAERIYVHKSVYDKFVARVTERLKTIPQGFDAVDGRVNSFGSMTMPAQLEKVESLVNDAVSKGAKVASGGKRNDNYKGGLFYEPTVLINVNHEMKVVADECFGPVMPIIPWETEEQLLKWVNGTEYGLCASIFSKNLARANRLGKAIVSGMCVVNDFGLPYLIQDCPFGGCKVRTFFSFHEIGSRDFAVAFLVVYDVNTCYDQKIDYIFTSLTLLLSETKRPNPFNSKFIFYVGSSLVLTLFVHRIGFWFRSLQRS